MCACVHMCACVCAVCVCVCVCVCACVHVCLNSTNSKWYALVAVYRLSQLYIM